MRAITVEPDTHNLSLTDVDSPTAGPGEVRIAVAAAGVNRADLAQRVGLYPPPPGASEILGMEVSGTIETVGPGVTGWHVGDEVCALLPGGGYAELAVAAQELLLPIPPGVPLVDAAALPEVCCTVWSNVIMTGELTSGETLLVHGGGSGIGTCAIQIGKAIGAHVIVTVGSQHKADACLALGADQAINYRTTNFEQELSDIDVIFDIIGGNYLAKNVATLATNGRLVIIGTQGGATGELNIGALMRKRASLHATTLRARPLTGAGSRGDIVAAVQQHVWPLITSGTVKPIISQRLPIAEAAKAHELLDADTSVGKVLLTF